MSYYAEEPSVKQVFLSLVVMDLTVVVLGLSGGFP